MKKATTILLAIMMLFAAPAHSAIVVYVPHQDTTMRVAALHPDGDGDVKVVHRKKIGWLGIVAISSGVIGLVVGAIPFGIGGVVFGIFGLAGKRRKLKGLAIVGLILGAIDIIVGIFLVAALL